jgi:hypothetical protein
MEKNVIYKKARGKGKTGPEHGPSTYTWHTCTFCRKRKLTSCFLEEDIDGVVECCACDTQHVDDQESEAQEERQRVVVDALVSRIRDLESQIKALKRN